MRILENSRRLLAIPQDKKEYKAIYDALKELDPELTLDRFRGYMEELAEEYHEEHHSILRHVAKALKNSIKDVIIHKNSILKAETLIRLWPRRRGERARWNQALASKKTNDNGR